MKAVLVGLTLLALCVASAHAALKAGECEGVLFCPAFLLPLLLAPDRDLVRLAVCIKVVETVKGKLDKKDLKNKTKVIAAIKAFCKTAKDRENRFVRGSTLLHSLFDITRSPAVLVRVAVLLCGRHRRRCHRSAECDRRSSGERHSGGQDL
jgi:hypothetical protein